MDLEQRQKPEGVGKAGSFPVFQGKKETMTQEAKWSWAPTMDLLGTTEQAWARQWDPKRGAQAPQQGLLKVGWVDSLDSAGGCPLSRLAQWCSVGSLLLLRCPVMDTPGLCLLGHCTGPGVALTFHTMSPHSWPFSYSLRPSPKCSPSLHFHSLPEVYCSDALFNILLKQLSFPLRPPEEWNLK